MTLREPLRAALAEPLARARFEPPANVCASCHHGGWRHSLTSVCLDCGDYFASMDEDEKWAFGLAALRSDPATTTALAEALHEACLRDWAARPAGSMMTVHGVDAHNERASDIATSLLGAP